jgi:predicted O-methyltransferase YrrM
VQGFFTPYRYADQVKPPTGYPELEAVFAAAEQSMLEVLDRIDQNAEALVALDGPPPLPRWDQSWFPRLDGAAAWAITTAHAPERIIEVGSGHSTRMLTHAASEPCSITCIDPQPRAVLEGLPINWHREVLAEHHLPMFAELQSGDIAFFDSSHVLWPGSDVDMIFNRILPALRPGVLVHIHDILLPDPYPPGWDWRGYTEQNGLAGWLLGGAEIVFSSHYARTRLGATDRPGIARLPCPEGALETSLWLRRC